MLSDLNHVDYAIFDKTGTLTSGNFKVETLFFGNQYLQIDQDKLDISSLQQLEEADQALFTIENNNSEDKQDKQNFVNDELENQF